jgi:hypothetical protein
MPLTTHQRRQIKALAGTLGCQAIGVRLGIPRGEVKLALESLRQENRRFCSPDLPGVPQLSDDEADMASSPRDLTDFAESLLTQRIGEITREIRRYKGESSEVVYA